jgi:membrane protein DedA with SNARE-associated domain
VLIAFASVTGGLVTLATHIINHLGYEGIALLVVAAGVIVAPGTEAPMLFAGFSVYDGKLSLVGVIIAGVIGDVIGVCIAYAIGFFGGRELIERHGSLIHVSTAELDRADGWFARWGAPVMFVGRFTPLIRLVFPYSAGISRMPFLRCVGFATLGSIGWIGGLAVLGRAVGSQWPSWKDHLDYVDYAALIVLIVAVAFFGVRHYRRVQAEPDDVGAAGGAADGAVDSAVDGAEPAEPQPTIDVVRD